MPEPTRIFSSKTAVAIYADLESAGQSGIWKALAEKQGALSDEFKAGFQKGFASAPGGVPLTRVSEAGVSAFLKQAAIAEFAVVLEGEKAFDNLGSQQFDADFGSLIVFRLDRAVDLSAGIEQLLQTAEQQKAGLRAKIESTRKTVGPAEVFEVPPEVFDQETLPFSVSAAIGPGEKGTVLAMGRAETVQNYLLGKSPGNLPASATGVLSKKGQIWLAMPISESAAKSLGGGGSAMPNPMLAAVAEQFAKVRNVGLGLDFGSDQIGLEFAVGCADKEAAGQLLSTVQAFTGMMQLSASQQKPAATPPFLGKLKTTVEATTMRLTSAFTMKDFDVAFQSASGGGATSRSPTPKSAPTRAQVPKQAQPPPEVREAPSLPPVQLRFLGVIPGETGDFRMTRLEILNRAAKPVKEIKVSFVYSDGTGRPVGYWTRRHSSPTSELLTPANSTNIVECPAFKVPPSMRKVAATLNEVVFEGNEVWTPTAP